VLIEAWRQFYNERQPTSALGYRPTGARARVRTAASGLRDQGCGGRLRVERRRSVQWSSWTRPVVRFNSAPRSAPPVGA